MAALQDRRVTGQARVTLETAGPERLARLTGPIVLAEVSALLPGMSALPVQAGLTLDLSGATALDTAGAWLVASTARRTGAQIAGETGAQAVLLETVTKALPPATPPAPHPPNTPLEDLGRAAVSALRGLIEITGFFGLVVARLGRTVLQPRRLRFTALVFHMQQAGLNAVPIVALMAFLIGIVLAYQGADQLRQFGAEVFVVDLIAISVLRELGILLTAIIVAGRSASAFTASIGSMKMREEVDAMRTLGLDPVEVLVLPRVLALLIMLPVLGFVAAITGLLGGALMSWYELGISPGIFRTRLLETDVSHFVVGMAKAPFFAVIIGVVGCFQGLKVEGNAESLGRRTSRSVVQAIFMVILADATFSIFFAAVGV